MRNNIRIAHELVKIAKELIALDPYQRNKQKTNFQKAINNPTTKNLNNLSKSFSQPTPKKQNSIPSNKTSEKLPREFSASLILSKEDEPKTR